MLVLPAVSGLVPASLVLSAKVCYEAKVNSEGGARRHLRSLIRPLCLLLTSTQYMYM